jgi:hypothetical protein
VATAARTGWLLLGGIVTGVVLTAGSVLGYVGLNWPATTRTEQTTTTVSAAVTTLDLQSDLGDVVVTASPEQSQGVIDRRVSWAWSKPTVDQTVLGGVLRIRSRCGRIFAGECTVSHVVRVPPQVVVQVTTANGTIRAQGVSGDVRLTTGTGSIEVIGCTGGLEASSEDEGNVIGTGLRGSDSRIKVKRGDVRLAYATPPSMVRVASERSGDIDIAVPDGTVRDRYLVRSRGTADPKQIDVESDPAGKRTIIVNSRDGGLTIRYAGQPAPTTS